MANLIESASMANSDLTGAVWRIKVIEGDRQGSSAYYPKEALQESAHLFGKGVRIYGDHPTVDERANRPERSYRDIIGVLETDAEYDGKDLWANARFFEEHQKEIKQKAEAGVIGMSIRAEGEVSESAGKKVLTKFTRVNSVDVVTVAGAGGGFGTLLESDRNNETKDQKVATLEEALDALVADSKANADSLKAIVEAFTKQSAADKKKAAAEDAADGGKDDDEENADGSKKKKAKPFVKESASFAEIDAALTEAKLPAVSRNAVFALVEAGADLKESVDAEVAKVKAILTEAGTGFAGFVADGGKELTEAEKLEQASKNIYG